MTTSNGPTGFRLTKRDARIIHSVYTHRALTSLQIARLHFPSVATRQDLIGPQCRHRLKLLSRRGYLERAEQPVTLAEGRRPLVYFLDNEGADMVAAQLGIERRELDWKSAYNDVKWPFLDHLLATNDIRIALELAAPPAGFEVEEWVDDLSLSSPGMKDEITIAGPAGKRERAAIIPDGYVSLRGDRQRFRAFVEADRATVTLSSEKPYRRTWSRKVRAYQVYFESSRFRERYQRGKAVPGADGHNHSWRADHMRQITEEAGGGALFWFATYQEATPEAMLFTPIWRVAGVAGASLLSLQPRLIAAPDSADF